MADKAAGSRRPDEAATALPAEPESARFHPGTAVSCTPVIMKKVRVGPVAAKGTKRYSW